MKKLTVLSSVCESVLSEKQFAIIGVSPFNSYFSVENIAKLIKFTATNFKEFGIFVPDTISTYTLQALGYSEIEANRKTRKQDNALKNKIEQALELFAKDINVSTVSIILASELLKNDNYLEVYELCKQEFNFNNEFRQGCLETSMSALKENNYKKGELSETALLTAVEYFLKELPLLLNSPKVQNKESCIYIYTSTSKFIEQLYLNRHECKLISPTQGYAIFTGDQ